MASKEDLRRELGEILPLDDESLGQIIENGYSLATQGAITEYWLGLLGESPAALNFITKFATNNSVKEPPREKVHSQKLKPAPSLISRPKSSDAKAWNKSAAADVVPKKSSKARLANNNTSTTTSQLLPKAKNDIPQQSQKRDKQKKVQNLNDLEKILQQLEISNNDNDENVICNCMGQRHPLSEVAPNCLNCGKIICVKEGLRPCSFCGHELISQQEKNQIIQLIQQEKDQLVVNSPSKSKERNEKKKKVTIATGAGVNLWKAQEKLFDKLEREQKIKAIQKKKKEEQAQKVAEQTAELAYYENQKEQDPDLLKAKENLDNLLNFQANGAERTKIIDQASDFDLPTGNNLNMWSSAVERTLQLKKQQKQRRIQEEKEKALVGRSRQVVNITIGKDGKAVLKEVRAQNQESDNDKEDEDIKKLEAEIRDAKNSKAEDDFKSVWDYEKDKSRWEKPIYSNEVHSDNKDEDQRGKSQAASQNWDRVQMRQGTESLEEMLVDI